MPQARVWSGKDHTDSRVRAVREVVNEGREISRVWRGRLHGVLCATGEGEGEAALREYACASTHFGTFCKKLVGTSTQRTDKSTACIHSMASASETQPVQQAVDIR
jgi:hypothetical protein